MILPGPWAFVVLGLASYSLWVLLSADFVFDRLRGRVAPDGSRARDFLDCEWCAGFWTSALVAVAWYGFTGPDGWDVLGWLITTLALRVIVVALSEAHTYVLLHMR